MIEALRQHLDVPSPADVLQPLMLALIGKPTRTWSGRRSNRDVYWDDSIEELFVARGGREINNSLGYQEDSL